MGGDRGCSSRGHGAPLRAARLEASVLASGAIVLVLALAVPAAAGVEQPAVVAKPLMFDGVTVVDVEHGKLVPDQRVVIVGNRIHAVGSSGVVSRPKGAKVVDARGKYLIPGLWEMHAHTTSDFPYPLLIANGITGIRDAYSYVPLDTMVRWQREILAGKRVGPPRQLLTGDHQSLRELTEEAIAARKARGANFIKLYPFNYKGAAAARRVGLPFGGHVHGESAIEASDSGMNIIDHVNTAGDLDQLCMGSKGSVERCQPVAERFRRNNTWWMPSLTGEFPGPIVDRLLKVAGQFWSDSIPKGNWLHDVVHVDSTDSLRFLSIVQRVSLPIVAGTDVNVGPCCMRTQPPGLSLHAELATYVTEGLTPLGALQAATLNPAKLLHATDSLGTVAPGKLADLVLLDADPLANITNTTLISAVVANGRYFDRAALDRFMADVQAQAKRFRYWWVGGQRRKAAKLEDAP